MARIIHGILVPAVARTVLVDAATTQITVLNRTIGTEIYFTVDGTPPVIGGDNCYVVTGSKVIPTPIYQSTTAVQLISTGGPAFSVVGESA